MPLVLLAVMGALAGVLATRLMRMDTDLPTAMIIGMLGAFWGAVGVPVSGDIRVLGRGVHSGAAGIAAAAVAVAEIRRQKVALAASRRRPALAPARPVS